MKIFWHGHACFQIITRKRKSAQGNKKISIIIDPFSEDIGLRLPKLEADILLITHDHSDHNNIEAVSGKPFLITGPGEYEIKDIFIRGISAYHDESKGKERGQVTIYTIRAEGITLCHLGDLGQKELTEEQVERIGDVDILMIPIGGKYTISAKESFKIMSQIEPKITIPMHYKIPKLKISLSGLDNFLEVLGLKSIRSETKLSITKKDLPKEEEAKIIVLKPK
jgi:L-ascorbate metabolism protein UlaG (beta-lactamase superfamily)